MKTSLSAACAFTLLTTSLLAQSDEVQLPEKVKALIPAKTEILHAATADVDGDELADYIVAAEDTASADAEDPTRTVFVIRQKPEGEFGIAARNASAIISRANGGLSDSFEGVKAEKKQFTLLHSGGRRDKWTAAYTFGYSRIDQAWQLIRVEASRWSETGEMQTFKPPHDFGKIAFADFDAEKWQGLGEGYRKSKLSKPKIPE